MPEGQDEKEKIDYLCIVNLLMSLFRLTAQDIRFGDSEKKSDAEEFVNSGWFIYICDSLDLEPSKVKYLIVNSNKIGSRVRYE
jgi:hypothetical protein